MRLEGLAKRRGGVAGRHSGLLVRARLRRRSPPPGVMAGGGKRGRHADAGGGAEGGREGGGGVRLHRCRVADYRPSPVSALAAARGAAGKGALCGVAREDGTVELWAVGGGANGSGGSLALRSPAWERVAVIPGREEMSGITSLEILPPLVAGAPPRVVVAGLDGLVSQLCPVALRRVARADSAGGSVWGMALRPRAGSGDGGDSGDDVLALACEDGCVRLFSADQAGVGFMRSFQRASAHRLLSVAWRADGSVLAAGGADGCVRVFDAATGREDMRITASARAPAALGGKGIAEVSEDACVWSVAFVAGGAVASGDASGAVQLWDAATGARIAGFDAHDADVLALEVSPSGRSLYSTGIDTKVCVYEEVRRGGRASPEAVSWVLKGFKRPHTHDVRALALALADDSEPLLLSAGNDARVVAHSVPHFFEQHPWHPTAAPQRTPCALAHNAGVAGAGSGGGGGYGAPLLLAANGAALDVWRLRAAVAKGVVGAGAPPDHVLRICLEAKHGGKSAPPLVHAAVSADGTLAASVDARGAVRAYALAPIARDAAGGASARRVAASALTRVPAAQLVAVSASAGTPTLVAAGARDVGSGAFECTVSALSVSSSTKSAGMTLVMCSFKCAPALAALTASEAADGGLWIAVADATRVHVLKLSAESETEGAELVHRGTLPRSGAAPTAVAFRPAVDVVRVADTAAQRARVRAQARKKDKGGINAAAAAAVQALPKVPLAVGTAAGEVVLYDAERLRLSPWSRARGGARGCGSLAAVLRGGGGVCGLSFRPGALGEAGELLVQSGDALVHANLDRHEDDMKAADDEEDEDDDDGDESGSDGEGRESGGNGAPNGTDGVGGGSHRHQQQQHPSKRQRRANYAPAPLTPAGAHGSEAPSAHAARCESGPGWRLVPAAGAAISAHWMGAGDLLCVECPWAEALDAAEIDAPVHRQRYGR